MLAPGLATHASILADLDQQDEAITLVRQAIALHETAGSLDTLPGADIQIALIRHLAAQDQMEEAEYWQQRGEEIARRELPPDSPELERFLRPLDPRPE